MSKKNACISHNIASGKESICLVRTWAGGGLQRPQKDAYSYLSGKEHVA